MNFNSVNSNPDSARMQQQPMMQQQQQQQQQQPSDHSIHTSNPSSNNNPSQMNGSTPPQSSMIENLFRSSYSLGSISGTFKYICLIIIMCYVRISSLRYLSPLSFCHCLLLSSILSIATITPLFSP